MASNRRTSSSVAATGRATAAEPIDRSRPGRDQQGSRHPVRVMRPRCARRAQTRPASNPRPRRDRKGCGRPTEDHPSVPVVEFRQCAGIPARKALDNKAISIIRHCRANSLPVSASLTAPERGAANERGGLASIAGATRPTLPCPRSSLRDDDAGWLGARDQQKHPPACQGHGHDPSAQGESHRRSMNASRCQSSRTRDIRS